MNFSIRSEDGKVKVKSETVKKVEASIVEVKSEPTDELDEESAAKKRKHEKKQKKKQQEESAAAEAQADD